jgi:hypothetical protein
MKMSVAKRCRIRDRLPGPWNEFAGMEWQACFQAPSMTFRTFSTVKAFLVLLGAGRGTFIARNCIRFMNSSFGR